MSKSKEELYEYFSYMQQEDNKSLLGGMAWDDIAWNIKYAEDSGISRTQLGFDFPKLLGHLIIDDEADDIWLIHIFSTQKIVKNY